MDVQGIEGCVMLTIGVLCVLDDGLGSILLEYARVVVQWCYSRGCVG